MGNKDSHKQILKSTGIIGGSQLVSIFIGIVRTKVVALILGPSGIGILGILQSAIDLVRSATGFGINFSGVKDIAEASNSGEQIQINKVITIIRRWALYTGILGMAIAIIFCIPLSNYSFGNDSYALSISILSVTLLLTSISASQLALLQGMRQIGQLAKATLAGAILGTVITIPFYWWLGKNGIVPGMICTTLGGLVISWFYARKIKIVRPILTFKETLNGGWNMAKLGFFIVITSFIAAITMYITRGIIAKKMNIEGVGHFQASWMISKIYIGIILNAMLADFFPRLSAINEDNNASNKLINEQLEMTLVIGIPMIIGLCGFSKLAIYILYTSSFDESVSLLQWQMSGSFLTLISWPLGVMYLAKGKGLFCIISDSIWSITYLLCLYFGWNYWGFSILGIAFLVAGFVNLTFTIFSVKYLGKFTFNFTNKKFIFYGFLLLLAIFLNLWVFSSILQYAISAIILSISLVFSFFQLKKIIDFKLIIDRLFKSSK